MKMTRTEIYTRYIVAIRARRLATTEGAWEYYTKKIKMYKEYLENHPAK